MSFLKQLLTPFVEFDADNKTTPPAQTKPLTKPAAPTPATKPPAPNAPAAKSPAAPPAPVVQQPATHPLVSPSHPADNAAQVPTFSPSGTIVAPLDEHEQYFEKLIAEANRNLPIFQGTDYKEFVDSKVDIDDITDEALRYKTAFNVLKSTGLTKEKLLSTGQEYLDLIGRDMNAFQAAYMQQYNREVKQKEDLIQQKAIELQKLAQSMNAIKSQINQLTSEIDVTKEQLNTTKNSFLLAGEKKQKEIDAELQKIEQYF